MVGFLLADMGQFSNVNVKRFAQARVNGGSNYDSITSSSN